MNVEINGSPILTTLPIFGGIPLTATLVVTWSIMLLLTLFCIWLTHDLRVDHVTTRQTVAEFLVNTAQNFVDSNMGTRFSHYAPFVAAIFSLSLLSSLSGLLGVFSPTADLSTELAWAVLVFVLITATKIKTNGIGGYLKGYTQPIAVLTPFNIISEIADPHFDGVPSLRQYRFRHCHQHPYLCRAGSRQPCTVRSAARRCGESPFPDPIPFGRHSRRVLALLRLVLQLYAGVHLLHAHHDVYRGSRRSGLTGST